jgi:hypothetical protein
MIVQLQTVLVQTQLSDSTVTGSSAADTLEYNSAFPGVDVL